MKIAVVGLGYVGLPLAVEFGKIHPVIGFDINAKRVKELVQGFDRTMEVSSADLKAATNLCFSSEAVRLQECDVFIITVPTPVDVVNRPDLTPLISATELVAGNIRAGSVVIYESTVYPGCTEEVCVPILEKVSGLRYNTDFFCGYSPERVNPGDKQHTLIHIKKVTSGSTPEIADFIDSLYQNIITAGTWKASSIKVAEAAKVIENSQRDLNIAFVNELSIIFQRLGIDTVEVLEAAGSKWNFLPFRPGMVGGHCIGVDPYYLTHKAEEVGYHPQVILAGRRINDNMARYVARSVIRLMLRREIDVTRATVGVLGITFKENCPDIRNSKVVDLIRELENWGVKVVVCDPWASPDEVKNEHGIDVRNEIEGDRFDSIIVAVGHKEFRSLTPAQLRQMCASERPVLGDVKSLFDRHEAKAAGFEVFRL